MQPSLSVLGIPAATSSNQCCILGEFLSTNLAMASLAMAVDLLIDFFFYFLKGLDFYFFDFMILCAFNVSQCVFSGSKRFLNGRLVLKTLNLPSYDFSIRKQGQSTEIFDSIRRKFVALTPEEWVRQHFINFLVQHKNYPASLISVERGIKKSELSKANFMRSIKILKERLLYINK